MSGAASVHSVSAARANREAQRSPGGDPADGVPHVLEPVALHLCVDLGHRRLHRGRGAHHLEHRPDAGHHVGEVAGEQRDLPALVELVAHGEGLRPLHHVGHARPAREPSVDQGREHAGLGAEGGVDGVDRHAGGLGDLAHGRAGVALGLEQLAGGLDDARPRLGGLLLADGGVVAASLDRSRHFILLSLY